MSIKINRLQEGHNSYPLVCRRPAETVSLQRRRICYRWGSPAYWSLIPRSSMFYLFEFCLKNMWNCSLTQQILSHSFYDWKLCELFLLRVLSINGRFSIQIAILSQSVTKHIAIGNSFFWLVNFKNKSSPLKLLAQMNRNLLRSICGLWSMQIAHFVPIS
jgi:hypothetical protein